MSKSLINKIALAVLIVSASILLASCPKAASAEPYQPIFPNGVLERSIRIEGNRAWRINPPPIHKGSAEQQRIVNLAWEVSGGDIEFLYMLKTENGLFTVDRQSDFYMNGRREPSFGFCQIDRDYHREIVNDQRFFTDERWQMGQCFNLFKGGVKFYGYINHRGTAIKHFTYERNLGGHQRL